MKTIKTNENHPTISVIAPFELKLKHSGNAIYVEAETMANIMGYVREHLLHDGKCYANIQFSNNEAESLVVRVGAVMLGAKFAGFVSYLEEDAYEDVVYSHETLYRDYVGETYYDIINSHENLD